MKYVEASWFLVVEAPGQLSSLPIRKSGTVYPTINTLSPHFAKDADT